MAQGIGLAGGFGAGGVRDALVDLIAQKMAQAEFDEKRRQAANAETLARETLGQRKTESSMEDARAKAGLRENQRQFGETLGLNVKKLGEDTRQFDTKLGEDRRQFDTGMSFKGSEAMRDQDNTERGFGLKERAMTEDARHNRASEGIMSTRSKREMTPNQQFQAINSLSRAYRTNTASAREIQQSYAAIEGGLSALQRGDKTNGEQAIVMGFNKILDPDSVVREGEYDRTAQGQAMIQRAKALMGRVGQGGVIAPEVLQNMATLARDYYTRAGQSVKDEQARVKAQAEHWDLPSELIFTEQRDAAPASGAPSAGSGTVDRYVPGKGIVRGQP
jgi:hypothetical protein